MKKQANKQAILSKLKCLYRIQKSGQEYIFDILQQKLILYINDQQQKKILRYQIDYENISSENMKVVNKINLLQVISKCQLLFAQRIETQLILSLMKDQDLYEMYFSYETFERITKSKFQALLLEDFLQQQILNFGRQKKNIHEMTSKIKRISANFQILQKKYTQKCDQLNKIIGNSKQLPMIKYEDIKVQQYQDQDQGRDEMIEQSYLSTRYNKLQAQFNLLQDKYKIIEQYNTMIEQECKRYKLQLINNKKIMSNHINHDRDIQKNEGKQLYAIRNRQIPKYINSEYQPHKKIGQEINYQPQINQFLDQQHQVQNINTKINQHLFPIKAIFNKFQFQIFTQIKHLELFDFRDNHCIRLTQHCKGSYFQISSLYSIPIKGVTKIGFKVVNSKYYNIFVGVLRSNRRKSTFSAHQENVISYKLKGGRKALSINGKIDEQQCEMVQINSCLWMTINRSAMTIQWSKTNNVIRKLPNRFWGAQLYPFITMCDKDDQIQVITNAR